MSEQFATLPARAQHDARRQVLGLVARSLQHGPVAQLRAGGHLAALERDTAATVQHGISAPSGLPAHDRRCDLDEHRHPGAAVRHPGSLSFKSLAHVRHQVRATILPKGTP